MSASKVETPQAEQREPFARQRPITAFLLVAFGIGWPALTLPLLAGIRADPFLLALVFLGLLAPAIVVSRIAGGPGAGKRLLLRATMWRFNAGRWALIVLAVPALTIAFAALSGTLSRPEGGVLAETASYLFATFIFGALIVNIWEETAWGGFAQTRLMAQHGLLVGSLLTAPLFAAIHIPLLIAAGWTWSEVGVNFAVLCIGAPFYRYLLGLHLLATGGSILAIGVQHAAWNAAGNIDGIDGDWQSVAAVVLLSVLLAVWQHRSSTGHPVGVEAEKAAATSWVAQGPASDPTVPSRGRGAHVS